MDEGGRFHSRLLGKVHVEDDPHSSSYFIFTHLSCFFFKSGFIFAFGLLGNGAGRKPIKHTVLFHSLEAIAFTLDQSHTELSQELVQVSGTGKSGPGYQPVSPPRAPSAPSLCTSSPGAALQLVTGAHHLPANRRSSDETTDFSGQDGPLGRSPCDILEKF